MSWPTTIERHLPGGVPSGASANFSHLQDDTISNLPASLVNSECNEISTPSPLQGHRVTTLQNIDCLQSPRSEEPRRPTLSVEPQHQPHHSSAYHPILSSPQQRQKIVRRPKRPPSFSCTRADETTTHPVVLTFAPAAATAAHRDDFALSTIFTNPIVQSSCSHVIGDRSTIETVRESSPLPQPAFSPLCHQENYPSPPQASAKTDSGVLANTNLQTRLTFSAPPPASRLALIQTTPDVTDQILELLKSQVGSDTYRSRGSSFVIPVTLTRREKVSVDQEDSPPSIRDRNARGRRVPVLHSADPFASTVNHAIPSITAGSPSIALRRPVLLVSSHPAVPFVPKRPALCGASFRSFRQRPSSHLAFGPKLLRLDRQASENSLHLLFRSRVGSFPSISTAPLCSPTQLSGKAGPRTKRANRSGLQVSTEDKGMESNLFSSGTEQYEGKPVLVPGTRAAPMPIADYSIVFEGGQPDTPVEDASTKEAPSSTAGAIEAAFLPPIGSDLGGITLPGVTSRQNQIPAADKSGDPPGDDAPAIRMNPWLPIQSRQCAENWNGVNLGIGGEGDAGSPSGRGAAVSFGASGYPTSSCESRTSTVVSFVADVAEFVATTTCVSHLRDLHEWLVGLSKQRWRDYIAMDPQPKEFPGVTIGELLEECPAPVASIDAVTDYFDSYCTLCFPPTCPVDSREPLPFESFIVLPLNENHDLAPFGTCFSRVLREHLREHTEADRETFQEFSFFTAIFVMQLCCDQLNFSFHDVSLGQPAAVREQCCRLSKKILEVPCTAYQMLRYFASSIKNGFEHIVPCTVTPDRPFAYLDAIRAVELKCRRMTITQKVAVRLTLSCVKLFVIGINGTYVPPQMPHPGPLQTQRLQSESLVEYYYGKDRDLPSPTLCIADVLEVVTPVDMEIISCSELLTHAVNYFPGWAALTTAKSGLRMKEAIIYERDLYATGVPPPGWLHWNWDLPYLNELTRAMLNGRMGGSRAATDLARYTSLLRESVWPLVATSGRCFTALLPSNFLECLDENGCLLPSAEELQLAMATRTSHRGDSDGHRMDTQKFRPPYSSKLEAFRITCDNRQLPWDWEQRLQELFKLKPEWTRDELFEYLAPTLKFVDAPSFESIISQKLKLSFEHCHVYTNAALHLQKP